MGSVNPVSMYWRRQVAGGSAAQLPGSAPEQPDRALEAWIEADTLRNCTSVYCNSSPPPRSTIATAYSPDGKLLASTHGDHTVKITCCRTGKCLQTLSNHQRTPWVVRFHPKNMDLIASGSLDSYVRVWSLSTGKCLYTHQFGLLNAGRPISSIAFHADGTELAVASGHRMYIWRYKDSAKPPPTLVLKTKRSLRAIHYHPTGAPFVLTAEVYNGPSRKSHRNFESLGLEESRQTRDQERIRAEQPVNEDVALNHNLDSLQRMLEGDLLGGRPSRVSRGRVPAGERVQSRGQAAGTTGSRPRASASTSQGQHEASRAFVGGRTSWLRESLMHRLSESGERERVSRNRYPPPFRGLHRHQLQRSRSAEASPYRASSAGGCNLRTRASAAAECSSNRRGERDVESEAETSNPTENQVENRGTSALDSLSRSRPSRRSGSEDLPPSTVLERISGGATLDRVSSRGSSPRRPAPLPFLPDVIEERWSGAGGDQNGNNQNPDQNPDQNLQQRAGSTPGLEPSMVNMGWEFPAANIIPAPPTVGQINIPNLPTHQQANPFTTAEIRQSAGNAIGSEQPCQVLVRIWKYEKQPEDTPGDGEVRLGHLQLAVSNAVLCSEMGVHFSPCGKMLAVCAATEAPYSSLAAFSSEEAQRPGFELRIYSLETHSFGQVLQSRPTKAAHCLTSIQFSPSSQHIMLAYGRRHISLLRSLVADSMTTILPVHTILEVYRVSDMSIVRVLPSAVDEVNTAVWHPDVGGGIAYGTKEGRVRMLTHQGSLLGRCAAAAMDKSAKDLEQELLANTSLQIDESPATSEDD